MARTARQESQRQLSDLGIRPKKLKRGRPDARLLTLLDLASRKRLAAVATNCPKLRQAYHGHAKRFIDLAIDVEATTADGASAKLLAFFDLIELEGLTNPHGIEAMPATWHMAISAMRDMIAMGI